MMSNMFINKAAASVEEGNQKLEPVKNKKFFTRAKLYAGLWFVCGTAAAFSMETGFNSILVNYFPDHFETDAKEIIESQSKHFDELKATLSDLKREVSSSEGKQLTKQIDALLNDAHADNRNLMISLDAIKQENSNLRRMLSQSKGIDGGSDLRLIEDQAIKIDSVTTIGVTSVGRTGVSLTITNNGKTTGTRLGIGASTKYVTEDNKTCIIAFLSESPHNVANFSRTCE